MSARPKAYKQNAEAIDAFRASGGAGGGSHSEACGTARMQFCCADTDNGIVSGRLGTPTMAC